MRPGTEKPVNIVSRVRAWWAFQQGAMLRFVGHRMVRRFYYEAAAAAFTRALEARPDHLEACLARGLIYWRELQDAPRAIADFSAALQIDSRRAEALFYRGMAHQSHGNYQAAVDDLRDALEQAPHALWRRNAVRQLYLFEQILSELPQALSDGDGVALLGDGLPPEA